MNWYDINQLRTLENRLDKLGYQMLHSKWGNSGEYRIGVYPKEDANPVLSRDAEIFSGSTEEILCWVMGMEHRNMYLSILGVTNEAKVKKVEEKYVKKKAHEATIRLMKNPNKELSEEDKEYMKMASK